MTIDEVKKFYYVDGLSAREVGEKLGTTVWQVIGFMNKHNLILRTAAQTQSIQFSRKPLSFNKKSLLSIDDKKLLISGLMLYWAEGSKTLNGVVDFANSNIKMVKIFLKCLRKIFNINEHKLRIYLYCYANQNLSKILNFWSEELNISRKQFTKPYVRYDFSPDKSKKMPYGLVHIRYNDKRLLMKILEEIDIIANTF